MTFSIGTLSSLRSAAAEAVDDALRAGAIHASSDFELADTLAVAGDLLRLVEALLIEGAAEVAERSGSLARDERLTTRLGCHDVNELLQRLTRCSPQTAGRIERAQKAVAQQWDAVTGEPRPARLPALREALVDGDVGLDGVLAVAGPLLAMRDRVASERLLIADAILAAQARGKGPDAAPPGCPDLLRTQAQVWATALDQDGAEPTERESAFRRGLTLSPTRDGVVPIRGTLLPEVAAQLQRIFDAVSSPRVRFTDSPDGPDTTPDLDERTRPQKQHDALATALTAAAASGDLPTIGAAAPTLVVSVRADDLEQGRGWAHAEGVDQPLPLAAARHVGCTGVVQRVALGPNGRVLRLGTEERVFNRHQRRAIALRDGNCIIPGCGVPAGWCEIHHVTEHAAGGPTHTDNGVLLCWFHNRFIDKGQWRIRMNRGVPEVQAPVWFDREQRWRPVTTSRVRMLELIGRRT